MSSCSMSYDELKVAFLKPCKDLKLTSMVEPRETSQLLPDLHNMTC